MSKFHINKHGIPAPCKAKKGNCPLGGADGQENHFDTIEEAERYIYEKNAEEFGVLPSSRYLFSEEDFDSSRYRNKELYMEIVTEEVSEFLKDDKYFENGIPYDSKTIAETYGWEEYIDSSDGMYGNVITFDDVYGDGRRIAPVEEYFKEYHEKFKEYNGDVSEEEKARLRKEAFEKSAKNFGYQKELERYNGDIDEFNEKYIKKEAAKNKTMHLEMWEDEEGRYEPTLVYPSKEYVLSEHMRTYDVMVDTLDKLYKSDDWEKAGINGEERLDSAFKAVHDAAREGW